MKRGSFYKELSVIEQNTRAIEADYEHRFEEALTARIETYAAALDRVVRSACRFRSFARNAMPVTADSEPPSRSFAASSTVSGW